MAPFGRAALVDDTVGGHLSCRYVHNLARIYERRDILSTEIAVYEASMKYDEFLSVFSVNRWF